MEQTSIQRCEAINKKPGFIRTVAEDYSRNKYIILMAIPVVLWYAIFQYAPMYGLVIAFKDFSPARGIMDSPWVGIKHFASFFNSIFAWRVIRNTLIINIYQLIFSFPAPIILALLLNEIKKERFKRTVQTVTYLPHFISVIVICGIIVDFTSMNGLINNIIELLGGERILFLLKSEYFRLIYVSTGIWQNIGWGSIIYLAALSSIDSEQYEAAKIDGANRWKQFVHVTLPGIAPTIVILLILNVGRMMSEGADKIILLYNENTYETADIISSFVYRRGLIDANFSFSAAVGLFNSIINFLLLATTNRISRSINETSLW